MKKSSFWISCLCLIIAFIIIQKVQVGTNVIVVEKNLDKFPYNIGEYKASDISLEDSVVRILDTDAYIFRNYSKKVGKPVTLYIGYYGTKKGGRSTHTPAGCYPGSGWGIIEEKKVPVPIKPDGEQRSLQLNMMLVSKGDARQLVYYWNQTNKNQVLTTGIQKNLSRFKNRLLYNRNDGAFIRVSQEIDQGISSTKASLEAYIQEVFPLIIEYWPEEQDI